MIHVRHRRADGPIESLDVTNLHQQTARGRERDEFVGLVERDGDRLFDQEVFARGQRRLGHGEVRGCRHDDRHCVNGRQQVVQQRVRRDAKLRGNRAGSLRIDVVNAEQQHTRHVTQEARMMVSEAPRADDTDAERRLHTVTPRPLVSTNAMSSFTSGYGFRSCDACSMACRTFSSDRNSSR